MDLTAMIEAGGANPALLFLFALILGSLHGLEPGHSKTMMAAYIVATQGSVRQAVLLGLSAAFSHSIIVWILAMLAVTYGNQMIGEELEPWFMMASGAIVIAIALWMLGSGLAQKRGGHGHHHDHGHALHPHSHDHDHAHDHGNGHGHALSHAAAHAHRDVHDDAHLDAHARAHAAEIRTRLASGRTGSLQTVLFGLTGGLIPCPAAITVFILCLHLGKVFLGVTLVSAFSIGLAVTLVAIGVAAALGLKYVSARTSRFDRVMRAAPYLSGVLIAVVGVIMVLVGWSHLGAIHA